MADIGVFHGDDGWVNFAVGGGDLELRPKRGGEGRLGTTHPRSAGEILHTDEMPVKTTQRHKLGTSETETAEHTTFDAYVRTHSNETTTLPVANAHKDEQSVKRDNILIRFWGTLSHDHETKFYDNGTKHTICDAHLSRELKDNESSNPSVWR